MIWAVTCVTFLLLIVRLSAQTTVQPCEDDWVANNGNCYYVADDKKASRADALQDCNSRKADLLILTTKDELDWLVQEIAYANSDGWWTRLYRPLGMDSLQWDDNYPPDTTVLQWNLEPDNANGKENCGAINEQTAFSDEDCNRKLGFICELKNAGCPLDWLIGDDQCFYISNTNNLTQLMTWKQATDLCPSLYPGATLADFSDYNAQDYLTAVLPEQTQTTMPWWVSLNRKNNQWFWGTTPARNTADINWVQEPNNLNGAEGCVMLYNNGKLADKDCDRMANYICKTSDNSVPQPYAGEFGCGSWTRGGDKCYYFEKDFMETYDVARQRCTQRGGDLLKIQSKDEKNYIDYMTKYTNLKYWTQLTAPSSNGLWTFTDGTTPPDGIVVWNEEPNDYSGIEDCVGIFVKQTWNDMSCLLRAGYICEAFSAGQGCPGNWTSYGLSCYFFGPLTARGGKLNWWMARRTCRVMAEPLVGTLLSVDDPNELAFVNTQLTARQDLGLFHWTGLNDVAAEGTLVYDSNDVLPRLDIIPWDIAPSCTTCSPDCTVVLVGGFTADVPCGAQNNYVCEKYASGSISFHRALRTTGLTVVVSVLSSLVLATTVGISQY